jgi:xanthine dehydrogenase YagS FAD-binding subunit
MNPFEYASPQSETEATALLAEYGDETAILASGLDLMPLLQGGVLEPKRVVDITRVESLRGIAAVDGGVTIGALTTLEEIARSPLLADYPSLLHVVDGVRAIQIQQNGTLGGDLCHLPNCWYFRSGYGLLAREGGRSLPEVGDNRYHAIFGNGGPAKFVSASRFAPSLIAWNAQVRIAGPEPEQEQWLPLGQFYVTPRTERQGVTVLKPGQLLTHVWLPARAARLSATYDVLEMEGLDWPLASAAVTLELDAGLVRRAAVVLGHVAPTPWYSHPAADVLVGRPVTPRTAHLAGEAAASEATPLSENGYKVRLAQTSVKRALLKATGQLEGGL